MKGKDRTRVRVDFTIELDTRAYRWAFDPGANNTEIRRQVKADALNGILFKLGDEGVEAEVVESR